MTLQVAIPLRAYLDESGHTIELVDAETTLRRLIANAGVLDEALADGSKFVVIVATPAMMAELKGHAAPAGRA